MPLLADERTLPAGLQTAPSLTYKTDGTVLGTDQRKMLVWLGRAGL